MSEKSTNQVIAEWMGKCWHEPAHAPLGEGKPFVWHCAKCKKTATDLEGLDNPKYDADLNLTREAELKAVEVYGAETYAVAVCRTIRCTIPHAYVELIPFITASASVRDEAVRKLIAEKKI